MKVKLILKNDLGEYESDDMTLDEESYQILIDGSKEFWKSGFEMNMENNGFLIVPPEIIKKSILIIKIIEQDGDKKQI